MMKSMLITWSALPDGEEVMVFHICGFCSKVGDA